MYIGKCSVCGHIAPLGLDDRCNVCAGDWSTPDRRKTVIKDIEEDE